MSGTPTLPPALARHYTVERVLASGGFGSVFLARQSALDRRVAIKLLHEGILEDDQQVQRFLLEAKITASFDHAHIVRVIDHGVESGVPFIAYEFLEGRSLADLVAAGIGPALALKACAQVAGALEAAHAQGVLHRDIKAANVMESAPEHFKVTDFGIARWTTGERVHTKTGTILGTPSHIAPEVVLGQPPGPAADFYAVGVMAFEALAGQLPFCGGNVVEVLTAHVQQPPPQLSVYVPGISRNIETYVAELLAKDPARRPAKGGEVARRLEELAAEAGAVKGRARRVTSGRMQVPRTASATAAASRSGPTSIAATTATDAPGSVRWRAAGVAAAAAAVLALGLAGVWVRRTPDPGPVRTASPASVVPTVRPSTSGAPAGGPDWDVYAGMVRIPAGIAILGSDEVHEKHGAYSRRHDVKLSAYRIDRFEVTNREFRKFLESSRGRTYVSTHVKDVPKHPDDKPGGNDVWSPAKQELPVVFVSWYDAESYCDWTRRRLPTEAQWERAARGPEGRRYPWGDRHDKQLVNVRPSRGFFEYDVLRDPKRESMGKQLLPQTAAPDDVAPDGVHSLGGSVREWVFDQNLDRYHIHRAENRFDDTDPIGPTSERYPNEDLSNRRKKGPSFKMKLEVMWDWGSDAPTNRRFELGFRCACLERDVPPGK